MKPHGKTENESGPATETCRVCGDVLRTTLPNVTDSLTRESFSIGQCRKCGLAQTIPLPGNLDRYYGEQYYGNRHGLTAKLCINRRLRLLSKFLEDNSSSRLLDVGCGDGSFLLAAKDQGWEVFGVEINPEPARRAGLDIAEDLQHAKSSAPYDCITLWHSLEHMSDINAIMEQLHGLLSPAGTLIIAVPNKNSFQAQVFGRNWLPLDIPRHLCHFDPNSLAYCLQENGLTVQRMWFQEFEYDLMGWSQSALNSIFTEPNVFIDRLMGKKRTTSTVLEILNLMLGILLSALALPLVIIEKICKRSGTIIVAAVPG